MDKRELIAKYFADLSKIVFAAAVMEPLIKHKFSLVGFIMGLVIMLLFLFIALLASKRGNK